jgi:hypothetical protein
MNTQLDTFQTALLTQLRREVIESPRHAPLSAPSSARAPRRSTLRRVSLAGVAAGVASSVAMSLGLVSIGGAGTTPAFAVTTAKDGDVVVTLTGVGPADAQQLEAALKDHRIEADVVYDPDRFPVVEPDAEEGVETRYFGRVSEGPAIIVRPTEDGTVVRIDGDKCDGVHWTMYLDDHGVTGILAPRPIGAAGHHHIGDRSKVRAAPRD